MKRFGVIFMIAAALLCSACSKTPALPEAPVEDVPVAADVSVVGANGEAQTAKVVLYYQDASDYLVPVMREIPYEEGIAKAALKKLIACEEDQQALAARGVTAPLPEDSDVDLDIQNGIATANLKINGQYPDTSMAEVCMIGAAVNTLLEFDTVETVHLLFDGQVKEMLPKGTEVKAEYTKKIENSDPVGLPSSANTRMQLYFVNQTGTFLVPVTRITLEDITAQRIAQELTDPGTEGDLVSLLPPQCRVLGLSIAEDGVATLDLSKEFLTLAALPANEQQAIRGINLSLIGVEGIEQVELTVEGELYEPVAETLGTGINTQYLNTMN